MTDTQQRHLEEMSKHIEVLLHASEAPLTANVLKKQLSLNTNELARALEILQQRLDAGVLTAGQVMGLIHDIPTCQALIDNIMQDAEQIVHQRLAQFFPR